MVLNTRDIEDSAGIFRFPVSTHKKSAALLKKLRPKLDQFGGSLGLKPLWLSSFTVSSVASVVSSVVASVASLVASVVASPANLINF